MPYEPVIGLEVHIQLATESKIFCSCSTRFGADPNTQVCPICSGMPGVLPILNRRVVEFALLLGLATRCRINPRAVFARKNYFYPDLPKGYQISQFALPFCEAGAVDIEVDGQKKSIRINRIHAEEDAGKSMHAEAYVGADETLIDLNRCGVPLLEVVSEPDLRSPKEAHAYLVSFRQIVRYLGICDGNMEEGSLRCDANVSLRPTGTKTLGTKTEIKNMNSFAHVEKALTYEIARQLDVLETGGAIEQETRLWNSERGTTEPMRSKEFSHDYRYFPEPDLVPMEVSTEWIEQVRSELPELPEQKRRRFMEEFDLSDYDARILSEDRQTADYFERVAVGSGDARGAATWVMGEVARSLNERKEPIETLRATSDHLIDLLKLTAEGRINRTIARDVFELVLESGRKPEEIVREKGWAQISDTVALEKAIEAVLRENPAEVEAFYSGREKVFGFLMGQVMRQTQGQANPQAVTQLLRQRLAEGAQG
ncbi:Asp-tRNA(Asn)/Glu-tRNA(Gln) amidotransferase subunit GatB [candidate division KSB1 bacterium]|nr:Asp-tRNA(Asn)/Glu-tRNA(Gln) amidotransferase subunit GatB [candidate division KSB1 bacterium]